MSDWVDVVLVVVDETEDVVVVTVDDVSYGG